MTRSIQHLDTLRYCHVVLGCSSFKRQSTIVKITQKQAIDSIWNGGFDINGRGGYDFHAIHVQG